MRLKEGDRIMHEGEMMTVAKIDRRKFITLHWFDDEGVPHDFGPFPKSEYKHWPVQ